MKELLFYYDIVCPYAYMASRKVEALAARTGARLVYKPILLGGVYNAIGRSQEATADQGSARIAMDSLRLRRQAHRDGATLNCRNDQPRRTVNAMRLLVAADDSKRPALTRALYEAYWIHSRDISDPEVLAAIAREHGIDPSAMADPAVKQGLFDAVDEAVSHGVFGVPAFVVDGELWWGEDRMHLVETALGASPPCPAKQANSSGGNTNVPVNQVDFSAGNRKSRTVEFFYDFSSPYAYLGSTQIGRIARETGATLIYRPMALGGLFKAIGTAGIPIQTFSQPKAAWYANDMVHWAAMWGVGYQFSSNFPIRSITAARVALIDPTTTDVIFKAAWADDRDIGNGEVLAQILTEAGYDAPTLLAGTQDPAIKAQLFANTDRAEKFGACGAPTFVIDEEIVIWGQDRMDLVAECLRGYQPPEGVRRP